MHTDVNSFSPFDGVARPARGYRRQRSGRARRLEKTPSPH